MFDGQLNEVASGFDCGVLAEDVGLVHWKEDFQRLGKAWERAVKADERRTANRVQHRLRSLISLTAHNTRITQGESDGEDGIDRAGAGTGPCQSPQAAR